MAEQITIFDTEVTLETIRIHAVAIGDGFTVTASAVLDDDDTLYSHTVWRKEATLEEASQEMMLEAVTAVQNWMEANA